MDIILIAHYITFHNFHFDFCQGANHRPGKVNELREKVYNNIKLITCLGSIFIVCVLLC